VTRDQKLEINVDLFQALTSVLEASPTEATPVVVLSAYLHSLAKEYGLSDSQNLTGEHLNSFRPPPRITPWLSDMLGGELEPEFLRNRVYRAIVELAQNSEARRLINRRGHLSETGALMLAQVHWNIERTETRPLLPIQSAQAITGKSLGAGDREKAREATALMLRWGVLGGVVLGALLLLTRPFLAPLFTPDAEVQAAIAAGLLVVAIGQPLSGLVFVIDGVLIGAGDGVWLAKAMLVTLLAYLPIVAAAHAVGGRVVDGTNAGDATAVTWLWVAFTAFMAVRAALMWLRVRTGHWMVLGATRP